MAVIEFFFDIGSSYSYLAATQIDGVSQRTGVPVRWRPFLLGAVFKATGNDLPIKLPAKARWMVSDMALWAKHYGIPARIPSRFPIVTLRAQRALCAVERLHPEAVSKVARSLFHAYWADDQDPTADETISAAGRAAELDPAPVLAAIEAQETKDLLRATTDEAVKRGAFGAPAMFVGETLFWGNDRLPLLEEFLKRS
ncbi:MAG TPA: 2-hydroxychromene-2-carboxylate isomerase [Kofleriaceae bacterium]|jgi:2-hydroxychromene-2-carboxylate isomerase|nr:2-hydroxychromene-2-carboxylate isomerase [Kofleriaceae bacterium]